MMTIPNRNASISRAMLMHSVHKRYMFWRHLNALLQHLPADLPGEWALVQGADGVEVQVTLADGREYATWMEMMHTHSAVAMSCVTESGWIRRLYRLYNVLVSLCLPAGWADPEAVPTGRPGRAVPRDAQSAVPTSDQDLSTMWTDFIETLDLDSGSAG